MDNEIQRIEWALKTVSYAPHMWSHEYQGTPIQILSMTSQKYLQELKVGNKPDGKPDYFDATH